MARQMKDSGIEWIGEIPADWELKKLKSQLVERKEKNDPVKTDFILSLGASYGVIPYSEKDGGGNKAKEDLTDYRLAYPGDIVMNSMNIISGSVGMSNYFGCVSPVYYMFYPRTDDVCTEYYHLLFQSKAFQRSLLGLGNGILMKESSNGNFNTVRMRIPVNKLNTLLLPIPSYSEQRRIAEYLDQQCAHIDAVIEKTKASIEEYKKLKQAVITEAVTKGVRGERPMKDSGIEWIGEIPSDWKVVRLKSMFDFGKGLPITKDNLIETGVPVISYGQIHAKFNTGVALDDRLYRFVSDEYIESNSNSLVKFGDILVADTSEDLEGCGNGVYIDDDMILFAGYHTIILRSKECKDNKYIAYQMKTDNWRSQLRCKASGVKLFSISKKMLSEASHVIPDMIEQKEITEYLDEKCQEIDRIIENKQCVIAELESYKKSLIYEYVTGKREVPQCQ